MKASGSAFVLLVAAVSLGAGIVIGKRISARDRSGAAETAAASIERNNSPKLPPVKTPTKRGAAGPADYRIHKISVAEARTRLDELFKKPMFRRYEAMNDFVKSIEAADIPEVIAMVEKTPQQTRLHLMTMLLARWAETDVRAAMAYADKTAGAQNRKQAVLAGLN